MSELQNIKHNYNANLKNYKQFIVNRAYKLNLFKPNMPQYNHNSPRRIPLMKRNPALMPFSRDHLGALMLVSRLKHGYSTNPRYPWPTDLAEQAVKIKHMWQTELEPHFCAEEEMGTFLGPHFSEQLQTLFSEILSEHRQIRALISTLQTPEGLNRETLEKLGSLLEAHVRKEESVFFEALQRDLSEALLAQAGERVALFYQALPAVVSIFTGETHQPGS
jgi:hypothetical protein